MYMSKFQILWVPVLLTSTLAYKLGSNHAKEGAKKEIREILVKLHDQRRYLKITNQNWHWILSWIIEENSYVAVMLYAMLEYDIYIYIYLYLYDLISDIFHV